MRDPDITGKVALAWESRAKPRRPDHNASLSAWLIKGPFHPAWEWWMLGAAHLRDIPGVPPAEKQYPEAEHEIMIVSLDPACYPPDPDVVEGLKFLTPIDLIYQFDGLEDRQVIEILSLCARAIADGLISPDQDFRSQWQKMLWATVEHYRAGLH